MTVNYSNPRMEAVIENWPIGTKRTTATFRIETKSGKQRGTRFTIDPKTGRATATKTMTYALKARIVDGIDGKTYIVELTEYRHISVMQSNMKFQHEVIHPDNNRYDEVLELFTVKV